MLIVSLTSFPPIFEYNSCSKIKHLALLGTDVQYCIVRVAVEVLKLVLKTRSELAPVPTFIQTY